MRGVHRAGAEVHEERLVGRDLLGVRDEPDGVIHQVRRQVISLLRGFGRFDGVVVIHEVRIVLVRVATQEAIEALEAACQGPAVIGPGGRGLVGRREVPLADRVGAVAVLQQHLREEPVRERNVPVAARIAGRAFGDAGHRVGMMVAPGENAGARGRAERGGVHVVVAQPVRRERVNVGRLNRAAVAAELSESCVIEDDEEHVRRALPRPQRLWPGRR